jgi:hypothetical protein
MFPIDFLGSEKEVVSLDDGAVWSGQPTESKTKKLGKIGLDISIESIPDKLI